MSAILPQEMSSFLDANGACFSACRTWRYALWRRWGAGPDLAVVGLNPSTADETRDDPTIRRCVGYAKSWGMGGLVMLNLFAFRATDPRAMKAAADPVGPANDNALRAFTAGADVVLCAWGAHGSHNGRSNAVRELLRSKGRRLMHLGLTKAGEPRHPLYLRADLCPEEWA